eukprot:GDKI01032642.1.p3 GENE.GDKI01032642.1~~GDKI01032642.1.p3  ORF type:complete len:109 (+),score=18.50 GDKI01032642.1:136-462(+)
MQGMRVCAQDSDSKSSIRHPGAWLHTLSVWVYWICFVVAILFCGLYVVLLTTLVEDVSGYPHKTARIGFFVHAYPGCLYLLTGFVQFNPSWRQHYPRFHRACGYLFYL